MFGLDQSLAHLAHGAPALLVIVVAVLLGLRHASDPDHLVAVTSLIAGGAERRVRRAGLLGLIWGLGHATSLVALGLPIVFFQRFLPESLRRAAEVAVGLVIVALALRLLRRWKQRAFHAHTHRHGGDTVHRHLHAHDEASGHEHTHRPLAVTRSPLCAYAIGLVHGMGGSASVTVLLLAMVRDEVLAAISLLVFAFCTAASMAVLSTAFGYAIVRAPSGRALGRVGPILGSASLAFGLWYALGAAGTIAYPF